MNTFKFELMDLNYFKFNISHLNYEIIIIILNCLTIHFFLHPISFQNLDCKLLILYFEKNFTFLICTINIIRHIYYI